MVPNTVIPIKLGQHITQRLVKNVAKWGSNPFWLVPVNNVIIETVYKYKQSAQIIVQKCARADEREGDLKDYYFQRNCETESEQTIWLDQ